MNSVLLHCCCAPCSLSCIDPLRAEDIEPTAFWYNPNIHPWKEYQARRDCLLDYAPAIGMEVRVREDYGLTEFVRNTAWDLEGRCQAYCYRVRMEAAARYAAEHGFPAFTTTLAGSGIQRTVRRGIPVPRLPAQLPGGQPAGKGAGLLYAEILRLHLLRGGPLPEAD